MTAKKNLRLTTEILSFPAKADDNKSWDTQILRFMEVYDGPKWDNRPLACAPGSLPDVVTYAANLWTE
jgi:hypothetical protein